ncbi:hypothetical protein ACVILE_005964 [Streptomyces sp. M18.1]
MEQAQQRAGAGGQDAPAPRDGEDGRSGTALELLVHGVGGTTPAEMLDDPRTVRVTGDHIAAVFRRAEDADAESRPEDYRGRPVPEAYVWCNLTSGNGTRALWLLLLPFMVVNLAHWMRPSARGRTRTVRLYGLLVRLAGLTLTVLLVAGACEVALDLVAWQCAGTRACAERHSWLGFLSPVTSDGGWWSTPGRRLALAAAVPAALAGLLWYLSLRTWRAYESQQPMDREDGPGDGQEATPADGHGGAPEEGRGTAPGEDPAHTALGRPGFWYGRRLVARLRAAHTAAALLTVAAAVGAPAARFDRRPGGPALLDTLGWLLMAALAAGAVVVVAVVCRRGRSERHLDRELDRRLVRHLPLAALALFVLALLYGGWSRPGWSSAGRLPGDMTFGGVVLVQGLLVVALAVVAHLLHRSRPDARAAIRGLGGPAVAMLACALGGVMSGGVAQRVSDWLDGTGTSIDGPPVLLTWQASVIPPLLVVVLLLCAALARHTWRLARAERDDIESDHPGEAGDPGRTRRIALTRALATLTDRAPLLVAIVSATTLLLGAGALVGALTTDRAPADAARGTYAVVHGAAETAQALGGPGSSASVSYCSSPGAGAPTRTPQRGAPSASCGTSAPSGPAPPIPSHRPATRSARCPTSPGGWPPGPGRPAGGWSSPGIRRAASSPPRPPGNWSRPPANGSRCSPTAPRWSACTAAGSRPTSGLPRSAPCTRRWTAGATCTGPPTRSAARCACPATPGRTWTARPSRTR